MVRSCMRYWHPFATEAVRGMVSAGVRQIVALPLYPHYSVATTGSSMTDLHKTLRKHPSLTIREIRSWPDQPSYIQCLAKRIDEGVALFNGEQVQVVYAFTERGVHAARTRIRPREPRPAVAQPDDLVVDERACDTPSLGQGRKPRQRRIEVAEVTAPDRVRRGREGAL